MKLNYSLIFLFVIIALLALSGCLFKRGVTYQLHNRDLILQNDSLISVNIELTRRLEQAHIDSLSKRRRSTAFVK